MRPLRIVTAVVALSLALVPTGARATAGSVGDRNDISGFLDIAEIKHGHTTEGDLRHVIKTHDRWGVARYDGCASINFQFPSQDRTVNIVRRGDKLIGRMIGSDGERLGFVRSIVKRGKSVTLKLSKHRLSLTESSNGYSWNVRTSSPDRRCVADGGISLDKAPDSGSLRHEL